MQNAIKLENISSLITSPSNYQCRKTTVNMKVSGLCYVMDFHYYWLPFKISDKLDISTLNLWILNWSSRFSACVTCSGYGRIYCLGQQWVEWVWIQCWSCILIDKYNRNDMYNTDNLFNFCSVYQLHFNRMKQNIDVYDFDFFADTIWN